MQCSCADVNFLYKRKCWTNSGGPLVNSLLWDLILFPFFQLYSTLWLFLSGKRQVNADFRLSNSVYLPFDADLKVKLFFLPCRSLTMLVSFFFALFSFSSTMFFLSFSFLLLLIFNLYIIPAFLQLHHIQFSLFVFFPILHNISLCWKLYTYISKMKERQGGESFFPELIKKFQ